MKTKHNFWVLGIAFISLIGSVISLFILPDTIPIHWNAAGEIDGYGSKYMVLIFGVLGFGIYYLMNITKKIDPLEEKIDRKVDAYFLMRDLITVLMSSMCFVFLMGILIPNFNLPASLNIVVGFAFITIGNYMPRVPHNYYLGAKTPWALADEDNWKKTQRMSGYVFCIGGICMVIAGILNVSWAMLISLGILIIGTILIYIYSWYIYKHS